MNRAVEEWLWPLMDTARNLGQAGIVDEAWAGAWIPICEAGLSPEQRKYFDDLDDEIIAEDLGTLIYPDGSPVRDRDLAPVLSFRLVGEIICDRLGLDCPPFPGEDTSDPEGER